MSRTCSIGERSSDLSGHGRGFTVQRKSRDMHVVWGLPLSFVGNWPLDDVTRKILQSVKRWYQRIIELLKFTCRNCGGGDRSRVTIYRPFREFRRAKIALSPVWCSRPTTGVPLAHAAMNFVGLDLTTSDRWHQKTATTTRMQLKPMKQSSHVAAHLCLLALRSLHSVDKFLAANIAASTFAKPCLYFAGDNLLLGIAHACRQCDHIQSYSVTYKVFDNIVLVSFVFCHGNQNGKNENR
ncbi:hypothetical protein TNCV_1358461 [Trichonephila clavipes]|uniref:Uncharacterized protein n=1 Tax=Trichonephila clavipes TaxID=2585209 RepID=A0A8X6SFT9_TRICX|nr:hypothetical protein TNCV_1358461 [Trichonephila clavipes]